MALSLNTACCRPIFVQQQFGMGNYTEIRTVFTVKTINSNDVVIRAAGTGRDPGCIRPLVGEREHETFSEAADDLSPQSRRTECSEEDLMEWAG